MKISTIFPIFCLLMVTLIYSCEKEKLTLPCPCITEISADEAPFGTQIELLGENLLFPKLDHYSIFIGGEKLRKEHVLSLDSASQTITIEIPEGMASGEVTISYDNGFEQHCDLSKQLTAPSFYYQPTLEGISLLAGSRNEPNYAEGTRTEARFNLPTGVDIDAEGDVYVSDLGNHVIRKIDAETGFTSLVAGSPEVPGLDDQPQNGLGARFNSPVDLAIHQSAALMYIAERGSCRIRKLNLSTTGVVTLAGRNGECDGAEEGDNITGLSARFKAPEGITVEERTGRIFLSDIEDQRIRVIESEFPNDVQTFAGGGSLPGSCEQQDDTGADASFCAPDGLTVVSGEQDFSVFVLEKFVPRLSRINTNQEVQTLSISSSGASFSNSPADIASCDGINLFIADFANREVLRYNTATGVLTSFYSGNLLEGPQGIAYDCNNNRLYIADTNGHTIYQIDVR